MRRVNEVNFIGVRSKLETCLNNVDVCDDQCDSVCPCGRGARNEGVRCSGGQVLNAVYTQECHSFNYVPHDAAFA